MSDERGEGGGGSQPGDPGSDDVHEIGAPLPEPAHGFDDPHDRGPSRRLPGILVAVAVALVLVIALVVIRRGPPESIDAGSSAQAATGGSAPATNGATLAPVPAAGPRGTTEANPTPTSTPASSPATSTPTPTGLRTISSEGVVGVPLGIPMDEAVDRISDELGPPDADGRDTTRCGELTRLVRWGTLRILQGTQPGDDKFRTLVYSRDEPKTAPLGLLVGGVSIGGPPRPLADVEAGIRSAVTNPVGENRETKDVYRVWSDRLQIDVYLGTGQTGTTLSGVIVTDVFERLC